MKRKYLIYIVAFLSLLNISLGIYGFILSKNNEESVNEKKDIKITYNYFVDDIKVTELPQNEIIKNENNEESISYKYIYSNYSCTNEIKGEWDNLNWKFKVTNEKNGNCDIYFIKAYYDITLTVTNGIEDENNPKIVDREKNGEFKIIPNEGYKYKESICSNNKSGEWDTSTNIFKLTKVTNDITCTIKFEKKDLSVDIEVKNGTGNTFDNVYYGDSKSIIIEPNIGYDNPTINCTNDQTATYENNSLNFEKVTNDTKCTVTFTTIKVNTYSLIISNPTEYPSITISDGSQKKENIAEGTSASITLQSNNETVIPALSCKTDDGSSIIPLEESVNGSSIMKKFEFKNISNNITCKIITK